MRARNNTTKNRKNIHCTLVAAERDDPQNANKTAHQIMIEAFNKHYRAAESLAGWSPRMLITKAEVTRYGLVNWESSMQFGWQDTAPHEGFKLVGYAPTYYAAENDGDISIWHSTEYYNDIAIAHAFGTDGETRVIFNEPDEYGNDVLGYNVWSVLQVTEGYEDTENLPDTFNIPEDNTAHLTPETALALYDTINHPEYHALNDQETLEEALTSLWRNISDYYAIPGEMHWVDDAEILWRTKDFLSDVHTAAEKEDSANLTTITSHHINTITSHPDYED